MWAWILSFFKPDMITQVQAETVKACGFLPAVTTVSALVGVPQFTNALAIATAICQALNRPPVTTLYGSTPSVAGVPIEGEWVK